MARVAFSICLNARHHFEHNDYVKTLLPHMAAWVFVEGCAESNGSTAWCKTIPDEYHKNGHSVDGTVEYLDNLLDHDNVYVVRHEGPWKSKEEMVNAALACLAARVDDGIHSLWEFDADEQWTIEDIEAAEAQLTREDGDCGMFLANHYVGKNLIAVGEWGEGKKLPYRRLWCWRKDQRFKTHEPPEMLGGNGKQVLLSQRFNHYAYYFEKDVKFKDAWYGGHEGIYERWQKIQKEEASGAYAWWPISALITGPWGKTDTKIVQVKTRQVERKITDHATPALKRLADAIERSTPTAPKKLLVVSHERSGTHFIINAIAQNSNGLYSENEISIQQKERASEIDTPSVDAVKESVAPYIGKFTPHIFKSHHQYGFFEDWADELFEEFHVVYIVRDGRDVLNSCLHYFNQAPQNEFPNTESVTDLLDKAPGDFAFDREYSLETENSFPERWANHFAGWMAAHERVSFVKYEDLEQRFDTAMAVLFSQIGISTPKDWTRPGLDDRCVYPRKGKSGDWIHTFTRLDRERFDTLAGRTMQFLKYYPPTPKTCLENLTIHKHTVALNIIVGGGEHKELRRMLSSFQSRLFDEVVVVCTTKDDAVWNTALEFTDKVIYFKWINDFAAARNCAIDNTESDYIWWADADDVLNQRAQRGVAESLWVIRTHDFDYYTMRYVVEKRDGVESDVLPKRPSIFKKSTGVRWIGEVHEALPLQECTKPSKLDNMVIEHMPDPNKGSGDRNLSILERIEKRSPRMEFYYGRELILSGYTERGIAVLRKLVSSAKATKEELAYACFEIGSIAFDAGKVPEANEYAQKGIRFCDMYAELYVLLGDCFSTAKMHGQAITAYKKAAKKEIEGTLCQNALYYKFIPADRLSSLHFDVGDYEKALWYNGVARSCEVDIDRMNKNREKIVGALMGQEEKDVEQV